MKNTNFSYIRLVRFRNDNQNQSELNQTNCHRLNSSFSCREPHHLCRENKNDPEEGLAMQLQYLDSGAFRRRNRVKLRSTFVAVLPHDVPTEEVEPAAGKDSVTKTPHSGGPQLLAPTRVRALRLRQQAL